MAQNGDLVEDPSFNKPGALLQRLHIQDGHESAQKKIEACDLIASQDSTWFKAEVSQKLRRSKQKFSLEFNIFICGPQIISTNDYKAMSPTQRKPGIYRN